MAKTKTKHSTEPTKKTLHKTTPKPEIETTPEQPKTTPSVNQPANEPVAIHEAPSEPVALETTATSNTNPPITETTKQLSIESESKDSKTEETTESSAIENTDTGESKPDDTETQDDVDNSQKIMTEEDTSKKPIIIAAVAILILIIIVATYFFFFKGTNPTVQSPESANTNQTTDASPSPTQPSLSRADWTLEVLNGSAKKGAAAVLAEKLAAKGYKVIKTGNNTDDVTNSQIFFADTVKDQADQFISDIKDVLQNPTNGGSLKDSTASARIIIGSK